MNGVPYPGGIPCLGKSESKTSDATKPVPFLKSERNSAGVAQVAHEKQGTVAVISPRTFLGHEPALLSAPHRMPQENYK